MALTGTRTFVGFGFGAIQSGLFLYEAFRSGNFGRLVVAEVLPDVVDEIRAAGGRFVVNIAHPDRIEQAAVAPVEICNPSAPADRDRLAAALAEASEIATAVPSVKFYKSEGTGSLHRVLAEGFARKAVQGGPPAVVYAAENHNEAAEILEEAVLAEIPAALRNEVRARVQFLNTVIGKMSGLVAESARASLATVTPQSPRAFLVEAFDRILISKVRLAAPFDRGMRVFVEKEDLLPFEEVKLFGHNAAHALGAYLAALAGIRRMSDLRAVPGFVGFMRDAFINESGEALIRRHRGSDRLFTPAGFAEYADDLLERMTNPFLMDTVERVARDPRRKLGWNDRLIGTMRLASAQKIEPRRYAIGAAAAFAALDPGFLDDRVEAANLAGPLWTGTHVDAAERDAMLARVEAGKNFVIRWRRAGFPNLQDSFARAIPE